MPPFPTFFPTFTVVVLVFFVAAASVPIAVGAALTVLGATAVGVGVVRGPLFGAAVVVSPFVG